MATYVFILSTKRLILKVEQGTGWVYQNGTLTRPLYQNGTLTRPLYQNGTPNPSPVPFNGRITHEAAKYVKLKVTYARGNGVLHVVRS
jgi:hypothetical protein